MPIGRLRPPLRFEPPDHPLACTPCKSFGSRAAQPLLAAPKNPHRTAYPLNGSRNNTVGAILDASVRAGYVVSPRATVWLDIRYLGGGATNTDPNDYAKNWLHFLFVGVGPPTISCPPSEPGGGARSRAAPLGGDGSLREQHGVDHVDASVGGLESALITVAPMIIAAPTEIAAAAEAGQCRSLGERKPAIAPSAAIRRQPPPCIEQSSLTNSHSMPGAGANARYGTNQP